MFFKNKVFKLYEAPKGDDIDIKSFKNPDDIDAKLNELDKEEGVDAEFNAAGDDIKIDGPEKTPPLVEDKDKDKPEGIKPDTPDKIDDKLDEEDRKIPPDTDSPDKDKETETPDKEETLLTQEFIDKMNLGDEEKTYLQKMWLDKPLSEALRSFSHAQKLIGKKKEELFKLEIPETKLEIPDKPKKPEEIKSAKDDLVFDQLKSEFPDMPKDPAERKRWLNDLNYNDTEKADDFKFKRREIETEVDKIWTFTENLSKTYPQINEKITSQDVKTIQDYVKDLTGMDVKEFGFDFTFDKDGNNPITDGLIADESSPENFDPRIVQKFNGIPVLKEGAMAEKFLKRELPGIMKKAMALARKQGFEQKSDKKVAPSLSTSTSPGKEKKEVKTDQIKNITDLDQIDALLDQEEMKDFIK